MLVGAFGSGKTSTKRSLFNEDFEANHISTDGADIYGVDITEWICKGNRTEHHSQPDPKEIQEMLEDTIISDMKKQTPIIYGDEETQDQQRPATLEGGPQQSIEADLKHQGETDSVFFSRIQDRLRKVQDVGLIDTHYSLWDFAGESLYYITHQAFLGNRVIYLLVTDLTKSLDDIVTATLNVQKSGGEGHSVHTVGEWTVKDFLCFWMNSIHSYRCLHGKTRNKKGRKVSAPPVIIVGTKKDLLQEVLTSTDKVDTLAEEQLKNIKKYIDSNVFSAANTHIVGYIAIDNKSRQNCQTSDAAVEELRQRIKDLSTDDYFCDEVPVKWIHLELLLRKEEKDTLELQAAYKLGADLGLDTNEVDKALVYLHNVGEILHYDSLPELKETVIVNVCWLVNLFKVLITKAITCEDDLQATTLISGQAKALREGILYETLVDDVLKKENRLNDKKIILKTMELYDILSEVACETSGAQNKAKYYVPCFLTKDLDEKENIVVSKKSEPFCPIYFHFPGNFLPEGLFYRFVVRCLRIWPSESIPLYKNYARFFVRDKRFHFIVHRIGADIMLRALTQSEDQQFDPTTFHDLRCTTEGELRHVVGTYAPGLSFCVCVKCPEDIHKHEGLRPDSMDVDDGCVQIEEKDGSASAVCRILQDDIHPPNLKSWYFKTSQMLFATPWVKPSEQPEEIQRKRPRFSSRSLLFINDELGTQKGESRQ
ncbi:probable serine/threonine-protein kinase roco11 [Ptychodera flava]|uniref:probable serine/threonine-protein kinase roco11 n=1 Tax=Ptychodera flava TaxID=63121 RepID=UPI003969F00F